jgi:inner membrane protein
MENIAHTLCGLRIADLGFRDDLKRAAPWVAVAAANLPDADSVLALFGQHVYLEQHRGFTHSFFGWPFLALIGAFISHRVSKASTYGRHLQLWALGLISHQILDWITAWGTLLLWPIQTRFSHAWVFIVDPMFWIILGVLPSL